jgi:integrase/head-tail adaptor
LISRRYATYGYKGWVQRMTRIIIMSSPWKDPRSGIYYIRRGVPVNLKEQLGSVYKRSLETRDPADAKSRFVVALVKCERIFHEAKQLSEKETVTEMSREEAKRLADIWLSYELEEDEDFRMEGMTDREHYKKQESIDMLEEVEKDNLARGDFRLIDFELEDFIDYSNLKIQKDSPAYRELGYAFLKASVRYNELVNKRQHGEIVETPVRDHIDPSQITSAQTGTDTLSKIYDLWKAERKPTPKLDSDWGGIIKRFIELHGDLLITEITRRHVASFKDAVLQLAIRQPTAIRLLPLPEIVKLFEGDENVTRLSASTVKKYLTAIRTILEWAAENGYRDDNPAVRIKVRVARNKDEERLPYSANDLKIIFSSSVYTEKFRPKAAAGEAAYWLPLLALYTGARLDELGQLRKGDVRSEEGVWFIDINTIEEGKSLKTQSSKRKVPLHPAVMDAGIIEYIDSLKSIDGKGLLFPELKPDSKGKLTGNWSKWWGRYARKELGITDRRKVFHSFRHAFKDACRGAGISEEVHDALTGHSSGGVGRHYGQGVPLTILNDEISKITYPRVGKITQN